MNMFPTSTAAFRHGRTLDAPTVLGEADAAAVAPPAVLPRVVPPPLSTAALLRVPPLQCLPTTPYYGLLSLVEVHVEFAVGDAVVSAVRADDVPATAACVGRVQRLLGDVAEQHGAVYHLGTGVGPWDAPVPPPSPSAAPLPWCTPTYADYVEAMGDALRQMCGVRAPALRTAHCVYVRVLGHPVWRDVSALLCVEDARLLLCVLCSSRVTQRRLAGACAGAGVALEWVGGAALVGEPACMAAADVNAVWVVWDALTHLPLLPAASSASGASTAADAVEAGDGGAGASVGAPAGVRAALAALQSGAAPLRGFEVCVVSSLPFRGGRRCCPVGRFAEEAAVLPEAVARTPSAGGGVRRGVARRYVWRLLPASHWVLPHFVSELLRCLVTECGLHAFRLRCGPAGGGDGAAGAEELGVAARGGLRVGGGGGVQLVGASAQTSLAVRRGASTVSWVAFSRLSGAAWVDAGTREGLVMGGGFGDDDDDGADAEVEFELHSLHYERAACSAACAPSLKRERCVPPAEVVAACADTVSWGPCFRLGVSVRRVIVVDYAEE